MCVSIYIYSRPGTIRSRKTQFNDLFCQVGSMGSNFVGNSHPRNDLCATHCFELQSQSCHSAALLSCCCFASAYFVSKLQATQPFLSDPFQITNQQFSSRTRYQITSTVTSSHTSKYTLYIQCCNNNCFFTHLPLFPGGKI